MEYLLGDMDDPYLSKEDNSTAPMNLVVGGGAKEGRRNNIFPVNVLSLNAQKDFQGNLGPVQFDGSEDQTLVQDRVLKVPIHNAGYDIYTEPSLKSEGFASNASDDIV